MTFDIHGIDRLDSMEESAEAEFDDYRAELLELFENSPEGQQHREKYPDGRWWTEMFMDYAFRYLGRSIPKLDTGDVDELLTDILIRKISLQKRDEALDAIPELIAFWSFIKREFRTRNAGPILKYLETCSPDEFANALFDPGKAGMAKSFFMAGQAAGFDMSDEKQRNKFMLIYNAAQMGKLPDQPGQIPNEPRQVLNQLEQIPNLNLIHGKKATKDEAKEKKKRKAEKAARKRHKK